MHHVPLKVYNSSIQQTHSAKQYTNIFDSIFKKYLLTTRDHMVVYWIPTWRIDNQSETTISQSIPAFFGMNHIQGTPFAMIHPTMMFLKKEK